MTGEPNHEIDCVDSTELDEVNRFRNRSYKNQTIIKDTFIYWKMPRPANTVEYLYPLHTTKGIFIQFSLAGTVAKESYEYRRFK